MNRYRVFTPFMFQDGDHLAVVLRHEDGKWILADEGHTYMHLTYEIDEASLQKGTRQQIISNALDAFQVEDKDGELLMRIEKDRYGDALFSFVQALIKISDVTYLSRERVRSTFMEDFEGFMTQTIPASRRAFNWHDPQNDSEGKYLVDCKLNGMEKPIYIFALPNDDKVRDSTISLLNFERWGHKFRSLAIFEEQESINRKVLSRFSDVCEKQYSSLGANKERISKFLGEALAA
ncbi:MAG: DUF1828 domain-containing protein [Methylacidiphilales bacterium]|nr:DUF1828 domain-containing protein [Candidatus Methylacidiphilales bacterium]